MQYAVDGVTAALLTKRGDVQRGSDATFLSQYTDWQGWARRYSRSITAASFNALVIADMCARCTLRVERRAGTEWEPIEDPQFAGITDEYSNSLQGPDDLIRVHAWHYQVAGEMLGTVRDTEFGVEYGIYSTAAAEWDKPNEGEVTIKLVPDGKVDKDTAFVVPRNQVVRFWMPDQEWQAYAWSPMTAGITDLKRYDALARYALKTADSAVAMSGVLWGPGEAHAEPAPGGEDDADADDAGTVRSKLEQYYYEIAKVRTSTSEDVTSVVPPFMHWDKEWGPPEWVKLGEPLDPNGIAYRDEALTDFARGTPLPVTTVVGGGVGDANHWSEWLASAKMFDSGVAPTMDRVTHLDLTRAFLWPRAVLGGVEKADLRNYRIGYDPSPVVIKPDNSTNALAAWRAGLLDDVPALEAMGFTESDLLSDPEKRNWLLNILSNGHAGSTGASEVEPVNAVTVKQQPPPEAGTPIAASVNGNGSRLPFVERQRFAPGAARAIRRLTELRRGTMTRLLAAAEQVYEDALRQAGAKFTTRARSRTSKSKVEAVTAALCAGEPMRPYLAAVGLREHELLGTALDGFRRRALTELAAYRSAVTATMAEMPPDDRPDLDVTARSDEAVDYLVAGLAAMVRARLLDGQQAMVAAPVKAVPSRTPPPTGGDVLPGLPDPDELSRAAARLVRNALDVHEGRAEFTLGATPDLMPRVEPTGERSTEERLADAVGVQPFWTWVHSFYGAPVTAPLDGHLDLDGFNTFERSSFDEPGDPELVNTAGWPYTEWYFPDDHDGCTCEWVIEIGDDELTEIDAEVEDALGPEEDILRPSRIESTEDVRERARERIEMTDAERALLRDLEERAREVAPDLAPEPSIEPLGWQDADIWDASVDDLEGLMSEAEAFWQDTLDVVGPTTEAMDNAVHGYTQGAAFQVNDLLRKGGDLTATTYKGAARGDELVRLIDASFDTTRTNTDAVVFRASSGFPPKAVGETFIDPGYVSTSSLQGVTDGFGDHLMQIEVPKGSRAMFLPDFTDWRDMFATAAEGELPPIAVEAEVLLPRGSVFQVLEVNRAGIPTIVRLVP